MKHSSREPVIVSLTPLPLKADSRTLKQVMSVHRFGYRSIVIEGSASDFEPGAVTFDIVPVRRVARRSGGVSAAVSTQACAQESTKADVTGGSLSARVARKFQALLDTAIAARREPGNVGDATTTAEIVMGLPHAIASFVMFSAVALLKLVPLVNLRSFVQHLWTYQRWYFWKVIAVTPRADLYYLHAFYQFPGVFCLCLRYRAKMIYDAHDFYSQMEDEGSLSSYWKKWVMPWERLVERACVWFADEVVTVNEGIATLMRERFGCEPVILRNVHDPRLDARPGRSIREAIGLAPTDFLIVSIGHWKMGMAMDQMLDAMAELPSHVHLAFLGNGYPPLKPALAARGIEGRVHVVPPVLPQEVVPFIRPADASVVLYYGKSINYQNALPNRFFQSIAAELPLVYPDLSEIRRLADLYDVGIMVDPQVPAEFVAAFRQLVEDDERRRAIRENLYRASRELCWEGEEKVLRDLFARHLAPKALPAAPAQEPT